MDELLSCKKKATQRARGRMRERERGRERGRKGDKNWEKEKLKLHFDPMRIIESVYGFTKKSYLHTLRFS